MRMDSPGFYPPANLKMTNPARPDGEEQTNRESPDVSPFSQLRRLILAPEQDRLLQIEHRLTDPSFQVQAVTRALPEAVARCSAQDDQLAYSLAPMVEPLIHLSVKKNPKPLANALYPIIGPAIRKSITEAFRQMVQTLNLALENSLSVKGLKWRWEAIRTGRPFAEIVMLHSLVFKVEQVFLIHRETGLLMTHVAEDTQVEDNANIVSAMLTALQDFVRDSFSPGAESSIETVHMEGVSLLVEQTPLVSLAGVIRGEPPEDLRALFQDTLEKITQEHSPQIDDFNGDTEPFDHLKPILRECLESQYAERKTDKPSSLLLALGGAVCVILGVWIYSHIKAERAWRTYVGSLEKEPGIVVVDDQHPWLGASAIRGLRDPLARDPLDLLEEAGLSSEKIDQQWTPFISLDDPIILERARRILKPQKTVDLKIQKGEIEVAGSAPHEWIERARQITHQIPGVVSYKDATLADEDLDALHQGVTRLASLPILFSQGETLDPGMGTGRIDAIVETIQLILEKAAITGQSAAIVIVGHADFIGTVGYNLGLSRRRAERVRDLIVERGVGPERLSVEPERMIGEDTGRNLRAATFAVKLNPLSCNRANL